MPICNNIGYSFRSLVSLFGVQVSGSSFEDLAALPKLLAMRSGGKPSVSYAPPYMSPTWGVM